MFQNLKNKKHTQINENFENQSTYNLYKTKINLHRIKPSELESF